MFLLDSDIQIGHVRLVVVSPLLWAEFQKPGFFDAIADDLNSGFGNSRVFRNVRFTRIRLDANNVNESKLIKLSITTGRTRDLPRKCWKRGKAIKIPERRESLLQSFARKSLE